MRETPCLEAMALPGIPEVGSGDDLAAMITAAFAENDLEWRDNDIVVVAQKVVSKSEGRFRSLVEIEPGPQALEIAAACGKDARKVQAILDESSDVLRVVRSRSEGTVIARHRSGWVCANAGIDESNLGKSGGDLLLLPVDPDASARAIADRIEARTGYRPGVIVTDTFGRPWRRGLVNVAIGVSDVTPIVDWIGKRDAYGRELSISQQGFADEIAAASGLLMDKDASTPVVIFRGLRWRAQPDSRAAQYVRPLDEDLFK